MRQPYKVDILVKSFRCGYPQKAWDAVDRGEEVFIHACPDLDNVCRPILNKITREKKYWKDDSQVAILNMKRILSRKEDIVVKISEIRNVLKKSLK